MLICFSFVVLLFSFLLSMYVYIPYLCYHCGSDIALMMIPVFFFFCDHCCCIDLIEVVTVAVCNVLVL